MASVSASATSAETSFSSPNRLSQMLPSTADNSNSELMVTRSPTGGAAVAGHFYYAGSDHNVMMQRHHQAWLPDGYSQIFKIVCVWPFGLLDYGSATLRCKI